jgi:hypothetical protein
VYTDSAVRVLAQLTGLQKLAVQRCSKVPLISRLHLTTLVKLTRLTLPNTPDDEQGHEVTFNHEVGHTLTSFCLVALDYSSPG